MGYQRRSSAAVETIADFTQGILTVGDGYADNVLTLKNTTGGYSAVTFSRDTDPAPGSFAIGINRQGFGAYQDVAFIATNPVGASETTDNPPSMMIAQHEGPALQIHARILFDGVNHITRFFGWDETNAEQFGVTGMTILKGGQIAVNEDDLTGSAIELGAKLEVNGGVYINNGRFDIGVSYLASYFSAQSTQTISYVPFVFYPQGSAPGSPSEGMVWYDNDTHTLKLRDNSGTKTFTTS